jgi:hypothetical protein
LYKKWHGNKKEESKNALPIAQADSAHFNAEFWQKSEGLVERSGLP